MIEYNDYQNKKVNCYESTTIYNLMNQSCFGTSSNKDYMHRFAYISENDTLAEALASI